MQAPPYPAWDSFATNGPDKGRIGTNSQESPVDRTDIALNRFGLGARTGEKPGDPAGWLKGQLRSWRPAMPGSQAIASRRAVMESIADLQMAVLGPKERRADADAGKRTAAAQQTFRTQIRDFYDEQVGLRMRTAVASETPFVERMVHFWSNHFAVSTDKQGTNGLAGLFEFEAIRPHVTGRFEDMLVAVEQHPAMLIYLDQVRSVGPGSRLATTAQHGAPRGLNENLAREIMELHTLGVRSGYSQADVTEFAKVLTGWTVAGYGRGAAAHMTQKLGAAPGDFLFVPATHEPGGRMIMGKSYAQPGVEQGRAVLAELASHPATARHLATKLARHFAGDDPPPTLVAKLEKAYMAGDGDLSAVYTALIDAPEVWIARPTKFRTPWEWVVASYRAMGGSLDGKADPDKVDHSFVNILTQLGQPVWRPGSPAGYDDIAASWAGPDALVRRVEIAERLARRTPPATDPRAVARDLFGAGLSRSTADVIAAAGDPKQGMALLLVAPEMMRR